MKPFNCLSYFLRKKTYYYILTMLLMYVSIISKSQIPDWEWAKSVGGLSDDVSRSIATAPDGNVYITGSFLGSNITFGSIMLNSNGFRNFFLVKYDSDGNVIWAKSAGGNNYDYSCNVATDNSGNVYITGYFRSPSVTFGSTILTNNGNTDIFLAKYSSDGNVLWAKSAGGDSYEHSYGLTTDTSDNIYITGDFRSTNITFGTVTLTNSNGGNDIFLAKYDTNGDILWAKNAGINGEDGGNDVTCDLLNNVYLTGQFRSDSIVFDSTVLNNSGSDDIFLVKYKSDGNVLWAKKAGNTDSDIGKSVAADTSGNVYLTGYFESNNISFGAINLTINGTYGYPNTDVFIAKYAPSGTVLWAKNTGNSGTDKGISITTNLSGHNIYLTGIFNSSSISFGSTTLNNNGDYDIFIVRYDSTGNAGLSKSVGNDKEDAVNKVNVDKFENVYITGYFYSPTITFGTATLTNNGDYDIFIAKLSKYAVINEFNNIVDIKIFPNPSNGIFNVLINNIAVNSSVNFFVENIYGQTIYKENLKNRAKNFTKQIDLSDYSKGIYFVKLYYTVKKKSLVNADDNTIYTKKIIIK